MKRKLLLLTFIFIFQSCGILIDGDMVNGTQRQYATTDPVFNEYVAAFEADARTITQNPGFTIGDIPINFGDTKKDQYDGLCIKYSNGDREIIIKKSWWQISSRTQREVLLYHELGHCRLNRSHDSHTVQGQKTSVMNPTVPDTYTYLDNKFQYLSELFTGSKDLIIDALTI